MGDADHPDRSVAAAPGHDRDAARQCDRDRYRLWPAEPGRRPAAAGPRAAGPPGALLLDQAGGRADRHRPGWPADAAGPGQRGLAQRRAVAGRRLRPAPGPAFPRAAAAAAVARISGRATERADRPGRPRRPDRRCAVIPVGAGITFSAVVGTWPVTVAIFRTQGRRHDVAAPPPPLADAVARVGAGPGIARSATATGRAGLVRLRLLSAGLHHLPRFLPEARAGPDPGAGRRHPRDLPGRQHAGADRLGGDRRSLALACSAGSASARRSPSSPSACWAWPAPTAIRRPSAGWCSRACCAPSRR